MSSKRVCSGGFGFYCQRRNNSLERFHGLFLFVGSNAGHAVVDVLTFCIFQPDESGLFLTFRFTDGK